MTLLPVLDNYPDSWHTTDIAANCPRQALCRLRGEFDPAVSTALFAGLLAGHCCEALHVLGMWDERHISAAVAHARITVAETLAKEGRVLTEAVEKNMADIVRKVETTCLEYVRRYGPRFLACELIGTEIPCRLTHNGRLYESHMDILFRDPSAVWGFGDDALFCDDTKMTTIEIRARDLTDPNNKTYSIEPKEQGNITYDYLARNLQMGLYKAMIRLGELCIGGIWVRFNELAVMRYVHLPSLKPFAMKTTCKGEDGEDREYKKGDQRPDYMVNRVITHREENIPLILATIDERARMYEAGFWPTNPSPIGCHVCGSKDWCARFDRVEEQQEMTV
jgi:hypothetical protein